MTADRADRPPGAAGEQPRVDPYDRLWSPWRMAYIGDPDRETSGCPFCTLPQRDAADDAGCYIVHRGRTAFVILNAYPYNPGHLMTVPYRHVADYTELNRDELHELAELSQRAIRALRAATRPHAFNLGMNLGTVAGAGIADHLHQHVVPRWGGDTNFMPVVGRTRVLPELLDETYERLRPAFDEDAARE